MNHKLGLHWMRIHGNAIDFEHIRRMQYRSVKLFEWMWSNADFCRQLVDAMPDDALFVARDHPLSEQKSDMLRDPAGTGYRHATNWNTTVRAGRVGTPIERTIFLGINEPDSNQYQTEINAYNTAFLNGLTEYGLYGGALSLGVGHPSTRNLDPSQKPEWSWYADVYEACILGGHMLVLHEYGMPDDFGWGYWCNRLQHCPWDVRIIVGECGIDSGVSADFPSKGYQHYGLSGNDYTVWLRKYLEVVGSDPRVHSVMPFTYDYSKPWGSFDIRPVTQAFEQAPWWDFDNGSAVGDPPDMPEPPDPPEDREWERVIAFVLSWEGEYQNHERDPGNWTGGAQGVGELRGTKWGISAASYPDIDIANLTRQQAMGIYYSGYWQASGADQMQWPLNLVVMDTAVLHGVGAVQAWLREVGPDVYALLAKRLRVYTQSRNWDVFGAGWVNRVASLLEQIEKK